MIYLIFKAFNQVNNMADLLSIWNIGFRDYFQKVWQTNREAKLYKSLA
jgi:5-methylthioribose kinase